MCKRPEEKNLTGRAVCQSNATAAGIDCIIHLRVACLKHGIINMYGVNLCDRQAERTCTD
jgi:hypothetical protein